MMDTRRDPESSPCRRFGWLFTRCRQPIDEKEILLVACRPQTLLLRQTDHGPTSGEDAHDPPRTKPLEQQVGAKQELHSAASRHRLQGRDLQQRTPFTVVHLVIAPQRWFGHDTCYRFALDEFG